MEGVTAMLKLMAQHGLNAKAAQIKPEEISQRRVFALTGLGEASVDDLAVYLSAVESAGGESVPDRFQNIHPL